MNLSFIKKIDFLKILFLIAVSAIFFMYSTSYYHNCFPNCYAWKEMMIKWCDGEIVRRGLLGTVFYALEPAISIRYSAPFLNYISIIACAFIIYGYLVKLGLPKWLLFSIIFSPALILFNLHPTLVLKKDIVIIVGCLLILIMIKVYWRSISRKKIICLKDNIVFMLVYCYLFSFFLLCFEAFVVFVPFITIFTLYTIANYFSLGSAIKVSVSLCVISFALFGLLTLPYIGDETLVAKIVMDWHSLYPELRVFIDGLTTVRGVADPLAFMMMGTEQYKEYYSHVSASTNFYELFVVYLFMLLPIVVIYKLKLVNLNFSPNISCCMNRHKLLFSFCVLVSIHFPLLLSLVAFDYGRWVVFSFYLIIFFLVFFTKKNVNVVYSWNCCLNIICWIVSVLYVIIWMPHHWVGDGCLISFGNFELFKNLCVFYSNFDYTILSFK